jgi:cobalt/nickel transport system permease protein
MRQLLTRGSAVERTIERLLTLVRDTLYVERSVGRDGMLQRLDARAKLVSVLALLIAVSAAYRPAAVLAVLVLTLILGSLSRLSPAVAARTLFVPVAILAAMLALPAVFITPGTPLAELPAGVIVTEQGVRSALLLAARVITAAALGVTLVLTTPWPALLAGLRSLGVPAVVVVIFGMTYRYIFLLLRVAGEMLTARRSRMIAAASSGRSRQVLVRTGGVLLARSMEEGERVYQAMLSRGFSGEVRLMTSPRMAARDWIAVAAAILLSVTVLVWGRS